VISVNVEESSQNKCGDREDKDNNVEPITDSFELGTGCIDLLDEIGVNLIALLLLVDSDSPDSLECQFISGVLVCVVVVGESCELGSKTSMLCVGIMGKGIDEVDGIGCHLHG